jgi:hypothetical protein
VNEIEIKNIQSRLTAHLKIVGLIKMDVGQADGIEVGTRFVV